MRERSNITIVTVALIIRCQGHLKAERGKKKRKKKVENEIVFQSPVYIQITSNKTVSWDRKCCLKNHRYFVEDRGGRRLSQNQGNKDYYIIRFCFC